MLWIHSIKSGGIWTNRELRSQQTVWNWLWIGQRIRVVSLVLRYRSFMLMQTVDWRFHAWAQFLQKLVKARCTLISSPTALKVSHNICTPCIKSLDKTLVIVHRLKDKTLSFSLFLILNLRRRSFVISCDFFFDVP